MTDPVPTRRRQSEEPKLNEVEIVNEVGIDPESWYAFIDYRNLLSEGIAMVKHFEQRWSTQQMTNPNLVRQGCLAVARLAALAAVLFAMAAFGTACGDDSGGGGNNQNINNNSNDNTNDNTNANNNQAGPCNPNPCKNGGTCAVDGDQFTCTCAAGFSGDTCETNIDDCTPNPCENGGTCIDGVNGFQCQCLEGYTGDRCEKTGDPQPKPDFGPDTKVIFLHHSTGGVIWGGGVADWFTQYNQDHSTSYDVTEEAYPDNPYPWANYPYDYWHLWVQDGGQATSEGLETIDELASSYKVVVFKHCFPVSSVQADTGNPDISSERKSEENYKLQYMALREKLRTFSNTRFIVWTGAALVESATNQDEANRAKDFFEWVINTWDEPDDNIYVWDFRALETEGGLYLLDGNSAGGGDSHPGSEFASRVAPFFGQRIVDVITGYGDLRSITGEDN